MISEAAHLPPGARLERVARILALGVLRLAGEREKALDPSAPLEAPCAGPVRATENAPALEARL